MWGAKEQEAFEALKSAMINITYLCLPDYSRPFHVHVDASESAVGACLSQIADDGTELLIAFASKKLNEGQRNWSATEREVYAIVFGCEKFESYLKGCKALIHSDHSALSYLTSATSPKLKRWALRLLEFGHEVKFIAGDDNAVADWLSRSRSLQEEELPAYAYVPTVHYLSHDPSQEPPSIPSPEEIADAAKQDEANQLCAPLTWINDVAYHGSSSKMYLPLKFRSMVINWFHSSKYGGHHGIIKTENKIKKFFKWRNLRDDVVKALNDCALCNFFKALTVRRSARQSLESPHLFELISVDFIGPRKVNGLSWYILTIVDHCSRFLATHTCSAPSADNVIHALNHKWIPYFGVPGAIISDHGGAFISREYLDFITCSLQSSVIYCSVEYPQGNGINEASHRILELGIKSSIDWMSSVFSEIVNTATVIYNHSPHSSIGDSPSSFIYGTDVCLPGFQSFYRCRPEDARRLAVKDRWTWCLLEEHLKKLSIDTVNAKLTGFEVGDIVSRKLNQSDLKHYQHISGCPTYTPSMSLPYRVLKVKEGSLVITPLFAKADSIVVAKNQCRLLSRSVQAEIPAIIKELFPKIHDLTLDKPINQFPQPNIDYPMPSQSPDPESITPKRSNKRVRIDSFDKLFE